MQNLITADVGTLVNVMASGTLKKYVNGGFCAGNSIHSNPLKDRPSPHNDNCSHASQVSRNSDQEASTMHEVLHSNLFLVKEHVGMFKAASNFDVFDPESSQKIIDCREENLGIFTKLLRFTDYKRMTPFEIILRTPNGEPVLTVKRGISLFLSKVDVLDENGIRIGGFKQKLFSIGGAFSVLGANDEPLCDLKGKWTSWDFSFRRGDKEFARVTKKWAGLGKELFTSADNYMISISQDVPPEHPIRILVMAAVMCIDFVLKE